MAKRAKKAKKPAKDKAFWVVLDECFNTCCGGKFASEAIAIKEAEKHSKNNSDDGYGDPTTFYVTKVTHRVGTPQTVKVTAYK